MSQFDVWPVVTAWGEGQTPSASEVATLAVRELEDAGAARAWGIDEGTVRAQLNARARLLQTLHASEVVLPLSGRWQAHVELLWRFWLPFALWIDERQKALGLPFIQGVLGGQGTGKTTLTRGVSAILGLLGQSAATLSLDDLYLSYGDRLQLQENDPRLVWRGPPGTHDIALGVWTLEAVKAALPDSRVGLPRFDKSLHRGQGDRVEPVWQNAPSVLFFEGWFVGALPLDDALFANSRIALPSPIETVEDRQFARDMNRQLHQYQSLWALLDSLVVVVQEDYRLSYEWRLQAEKEMRADGRDSLSDRAVASFVTYFWKALHPELFISPLAWMDSDEADGRRRADVVVRVGAGRTIRAIYSP